MTPSLIVLVIVLYFALLFFISWRTGKDDSNEAFFVGKKESPWYIVAFGMIGVSLSGVTFISIPGVIGNLDSPNAQFSYMQIAMGYMLGYFIIATVLMPLYYRLQLTSIYTYLEGRFGFFSYKTGAAFFLLSRTIGAAFRLFLVSIVLQSFVFDAWGIPFMATVAITLILIWIYTLRGGIKTIIWTDTLQTASMLLAVVCTLWYISSELQLGIGGMASAITESNYGQWFFWDGAAANNFFKQFLSGTFIAIAMTGLDQDLMQKNNSCKNIKEAQLNMFSFSTVLFFVNFLFVSLGALLYIYAAEKNIVLPTASDQVYPTLALQHFPTFIGLVFIIGLIAAAYSSADSALTALTTSFCVDFLNIEKKKGLVPDEQLRRTRYKVHIGVTIVMFLVITAFYYLLDRAVIDGLFTVAIYTYGPLLGLYGFGLFVKNRYPIDKLVPLVCIAAPLLTYMLNQNSLDWWGINFGFAALPINGLITFTGLLLISSTVKPKYLSVS